MLFACSTVLLSRLAPGSPVLTGGRASAVIKVPVKSGDCWFTAPLHLSWNWEDADAWILLEDFGYHAKNGDEYHVAKGFKTDFASIPRIFWTLLPPTGEYGPAAVIHDYLCVSKVVSRARADEVFDEAMVLLKVSPWKRRCMYWAVRAFAIIRGLE